jgi:hypothetical protein
MSELTSVTDDSQFSSSYRSGSAPAGLQVEEAEDQRAGQAEQRGRERRAHAASGAAGLP